MGSTGSKTPRAVLQSAAQLNFKAANVKKDVAENVHKWFEDGTQLGLTLEMFTQVLCPAARANADELFHLFDTDANQKVDALEVFSANIMLADGTVEEKLETLFPVFDFSGTCLLNFDELNILVQSVWRGLTKICKMPQTRDEEIIEACKQMFDAYNLPYDQNISKEQMRRWVHRDVEAVRFIDGFQLACSMPEAEAALAKQEKDQASVFSQLCGGTTSMVPIKGLLQNVAFKQSLGNPPDTTLNSFLTMVVGRDDGDEVELERLTKATRAWNTFNVVDITKEGEVDAKELGLLLWLWMREEPAAATVEQQLETSELEAGDRISRTDWFAMCLKAMGNT